ncbi:MAG: hypothetical protein E3J35_07705 [Methanomassiliicoccales archaeon]|nr:MAG: hypothetical protein E3J35_07705 [Methanomassiliicoccales archaeon]
MVSNPESEAARIHNILARGREAERIQVQGEIVKWLDSKKFREVLCHLIIKSIEEDCSPGMESKLKDPSIALTRAWLLSSLGRLSGKDENALVKAKKHILDAQYETDQWVRYWTLAGLTVGNPSELKDIAREVKAKEKHDLVRSLSHAILAEKENDSKKALMDVLEDEANRWQALRALRIVYVQEAVMIVIGIVQLYTVDTYRRAEYDPNVYLAITALSLVPRGTKEAQNSSKALMGFVDKSRRFLGHDSWRIKALAVLGNLEEKRAESILREELDDDNPLVVRTAARSLEKTVGTREAVGHIVDAAIDSDNIKKLADALRHMKGLVMGGKKVPDELEAAMISGTSERQEAGRKLLMQMGGAEAYEKLRARDSIRREYFGLIQNAEENIRNQHKKFSDSAYETYKTTTTMDLVVFGVGIFFILASALIALFNEGSLEGWAGVVLTAIPGTSGTIYGVFVAKPRERIQEAQRELRRLDVVFLGFLRELHYIDQTYTRHILEAEPMSSEDVEKFSKNIQGIMDHALKSLPVKKKGK